ncbi:MAG TPA: insulinase family protein [Micromonosporaceae bacterium]
MHTTEVDGVPVFWQEAPGPLTAGLVFGVGTRDETFMTIGVTHLVEHLVMSTLPKVHHETNASVDLCTTEFVATGRPEQVAAFLSGVCQGISAIPLDRLAQEAGVLEAEAGFATHPTGAALLTRRYGARDVGLEVFSGPGPEQIDADVVLAHARRFLVAGNAALWLTGPPPEGLRLSLPAGDRVRRTEPVPVPQDGPRWSDEAVPASGILLSGTRDPAWNIGMAVLGDRLMDEARHRRGLSYDVFGDVVLIGPASRQYLLGADARSGQDGTVAEILWEQVRRLAADGPTDEELAHEKAGYEEAYHDPRWPAEEATRQARAALFDLPVSGPEARLAEVAAVTRADVARCFAEALPTALIVVPEDVTLNLPGVARGGCPRTREAPPGQVFTMKRLVRLIARQWRAPRYYLTGSGLAMMDPDGDVHQTTFADVIGVQVDGDDRLLFSADGCLLPVIADAFRDGEALREAIDRNVPAHLRFTARGHEHAGAGPTPTSERAGTEPAPTSERARTEPAPTAERAATASSQVVAMKPVKESAVDAVARVGRERPGWYRLLNALGAVILTLATVVLYLGWRAGSENGWWVISSAVFALWCAWDARPARRRRANVGRERVSAGSPPDRRGSADEDVLG